jgi:hypothetical protein
MLADLNICKEEIVRERSKLVQTGYNLGVSLLKVYEAELWRSADYKSWKSFCKDMEISSSLAYKLMKLVRIYDEKTFMETGYHKLTLVANLDDEDRDQFLNEAKKESVTCDDLRAQIKEHKSKKGGVNKPEGTDRLVPAPKNVSDVITLLAKVGGKSTVYPFRSSEDHKALPKWETNSYVEIPISKEVVMFGTMKSNKDGDPVSFAIAFRRVN